MNNKTIILLLLSVLIITSCNDNKLLKNLNHIKTIGDNKPEQAMLMYDSIRFEIEQASEYVRMKGIMLEIRLRDKAFMTATSSDSAKLIIEYFDDHGKGNDAIEAHYYAGSIFRDLKDMPNALRNFLKAKELCENTPTCDSLMLRNIYSNLGYVYFCVQDYSNALKMSLMEYNIANETHRLYVGAALRVGENYARLDSMDMAYKYCKEALTIACNSEMNPGYYDSLYSLLYELAFMKKSNDAQKCYSLISKLGLTPSPLVLGEYYLANGNIDSAIVCYQSIIREDGELLQKYDAARNLFYTYREIGNKDSINKYASLYIKMVDSIDLGKRQEMAASVNNQYQYYRNVEEEARIKETKIRYQMWLYVAIAGSILLLLSYMLHYTWRKNKHMKEMLKLSEQLTLVKNGANALKKEIDVYKTHLSDSEESLIKTKQELVQVNDEISRYEEVLKDKEQLLTEKLEENKRFILLLHRADLEESAEDIVKAIRNASEGKYKMSNLEWQKFYHAVDELQPDLSQRLAQHMGKFTEQQQQVCYLLSIGLSNTQIENLTNIPHVTVWRWVKKFDWIGVSPR